MRKRYRWPNLLRWSALLHTVFFACLLIWPKYWFWYLGVIFLNHALITAVGLWPRSTWLGPNIRRVDGFQNAIVLTIDDGPDPLITPQVLALLKQYQAQASFFLIGRRALLYPELVRKIVQDGHRIENHSMHHPWYFSLMGVGRLKQEISSAQSTLECLSGQKPQYFRAPAGLRNPFLAPVLAYLNLHLVSWSVRGFDTRNQSVSHLYERLAGKLQAGAIVLLHDHHCGTDAQGQPLILSVLPKLLQAAHLRNLHVLALPYPCEKPKS